MTGTLTTEFIAFAAGTGNGAGADPGLSIRRVVTEDGQVREDEEILAWAAEGGELDDEDGEVDYDAAEARLHRFGYQIAGAGWTRSGGQDAVEVEPLPEVTVEVNVVTGVIETQDADWGDDDPRYEFMTHDASGAYVNGVTVEPWGEDEPGMERATEAFRDLGFTVSAWRPAEPGGSERYCATITGRTA